MLIAQNSELTEALLMKKRTPENEKLYNRWPFELGFGTVYSVFAIFFLCTQLNKSASMHLRQDYKNSDAENKII